MEGSGMSGWCRQGLCLCLLIHVGGVMLRCQKSFYGRACLPYVCLPPAPACGYKCSVRGSTESFPVPGAGHWGPQLEDAEMTVGYAVWWIGLGVLSSIGLGTGMHSGLLFLFPHMLKVHLTTSEVFLLSSIRCKHNVLHWPGFPAGAVADRHAVVCIKCSFIPLLRVLQCQSTQPVRRSPKLRPPAAGVPGGGVVRAPQL